MKEIDKKRFERNKENYIYREDRFFTCAHCRKNLPETAFGVVKCTKTGRRSICNKCKMDGKLKDRKKKRDWFIAAKGGKCNRCGKVVQSRFFHAHHINGRKTPDLKTDTFTISWKRLAEEVFNLELLCLGCHNYVHGRTIHKKKELTKCPHCGKVI